MRFFYALALGFISMLGMSQSTFQKLIIDDNQTQLFDGIPTSDGGYIVSGTSGPLDNLLIKYASNMQAQWSTHLGTPADFEAAYRIGEIPGGGYYVLSSHPMSSALYLTNVSANGSVVWCKSFSDTSAQIYYPSMRRLNNGGYIISATEYQGSDTYFLIVKADAAGNLVWSRKYSDYQGVKLECYDIEEIADGSSYLVIGDGNDSGLLSFCLDVNGNLLWTKKFIDMNHSFQPGFSICRTGDGGFIIGGQNNYQPMLLKINAIGNVQWCKLYNYQEFMYFQYASVRPTSDGGYILGTYDSNLQFPYLIKTNGSGSFQWGKKYNFAHLNTAPPYISIKQCPDNGYFLTLTSSTINANSEGWMIKTNSSGSTGCYDSSCVFTDSSVVQNVAVASYSDAGIFTQTVSLNRTDISIQSPDSCVSIIDGIGNKAADKRLEIFPNPNNGEFYINNEGASLSKVEIFSLQGQKVYELNTKNLPRKITVRITSLPTGLYILKTINEEGTGEYKVISKL